MDTSGILSRPGELSVDETVARIVKLLEERKVKLFTIIDHSGEAAKAGMTMPPTKVLLFGKPEGGTPVMLATPAIAIDLPLKLLVSQDPDGRTRISWNDPAYLAQRHHVPPALTDRLGLAGAIAELASKRD